MSSSPGWLLNYVPPPAEWNTLFANKADETEMAAKLNAAGTTSNDNALPGQVGEYISSTVPTGTLSLVNATPINFTSISLTPGDWDVNGAAAYAGSGGAAPTGLVSGISLVSATIPAAYSGAAAIYNTAFVANSTNSVLIGPFRLSLAAPLTTVYLVGQANFGGAMTGGGFIGARRAR